MIGITPDIDLSWAQREEGVNGYCSSGVTILSIKLGLLKCLDTGVVQKQDQQINKQ